MDEVSVYERGIRFASFAMWTLSLQLRRLNSDEPEDKEFLQRRIADFQFFLLALNKLRNAGDLLCKIQAINPDILESTKEFDHKLPHLKTMRNIDQHFDSYAINNGHNKNIDGTMLEVLWVKGETWEWLDGEINLASAFEAANDYYKAMLNAENLIKK